MVLLKALKKMFLSLCYMYSMLISFHFSPTKLVPDQVMGLEVKVLSLVNNTYHIGIHFIVSPRN